MSMHAPQDLRLVNDDSDRAPPIQLPPRCFVLRFRGWSTIRQPTDPDPTDEKRGASGYTFAFAGEADLDRVIRLQPGREPRLLRSGSPWPWGVFVYDAFITEGAGRGTLVPEFLGTAVNLLGEPKLEHRAWLLGPPGWEPIVPFILSCDRGDGVHFVQRSAPLDPKQPNLPVWQQPLGRLLAQGAKGINIERETVGSATGIWDALAVVKARIATLREAVGAERLTPDERQCLKSRLYELEFAEKNPSDRRVIGHYGVERFWFPMEGAAPLIGSFEGSGSIDKNKPWFIDFWFGAWDFDLFAAYMQGSLVIPFGS